MLLSYWTKFDVNGFRQIVGSNGNDDNHDAPV